MKAQAVENATRLRTALKTRSETLAAQSDRRQQVASSQWVSAAAMDSPLFANPSLPSATTRPQAPFRPNSSTHAAHQPNASGSQASVPPHSPPSSFEAPTAFQIGAAAKQGAYLRRRGGGSGAAAPSAHPSTDPAAAVRAGYGGAPPPASPKTATRHNASRPSGKPRPGCQTHGQWRAPLWSWGR